MKFSAKRKSPNPSLCIVETVFEKESVQDAIVFMAETQKQLAMYQKPGNESVIILMDVDGKVIKEFPINDINRHELLGI